MRNILLTLILFLYTSCGTMIAAIGDAPYVIHVDDDVYIRPISYNAPIINGVYNNKPIHIPPFKVVCELASV